jgi:redox-sensing transcriptional repressor
MSRGPSKPIPEASLRRLPLYHRYLKSIQSADRKFVSCPEIAAELRLDATQVRKDIEAAAIHGRPKVGYVLDELVREIEHFLGWDNAQDAFLVGAGSLGRALMGYTKFQECGLQIVAAFDADLTKIGATIHGRTVLPLDKLSELAQRMHVHIGIITVPSGAAQAIADCMVEGGMRAIWNFAPIRLNVPEHVIVHNEDLYCSLASLSQKLGAALAEEQRQRYRASLRTIRSNAEAAEVSAEDAEKNEILVDTTNPPHAPVPEAPEMPQTD